MHEASRHRGRGVLFRLLLQLLDAFVCAGPPVLPRFINFVLEARLGGSQNPLGVFSSGHVWNNVGLMAQWPVQWPAAVTDTTAKIQHKILFLVASSSNALQTCSKRVQIHPAALHIEPHGACRASCDRCGAPRHVQKPFRSFEGAGESPLGAASGFHNILLGGRGRKPQKRIARHF